MMKRFKRVKKVKERVSDKVGEAAANLNPLTPNVKESPSLENVPRITTENITDHREEVLKGARKYIYPLQHSKHRIVVITLSIIAGAIAFFFVYCSLAMYRYYQYNTFVYRVTQVVPFPIARTDGHFVDYENYLFELRHYVHYYQTQQQRVFSSTDKQLIQFRKQALNDVINASYIKILAHQHNVSVSDKEVDARITEVRDQNRLGSSNKIFANVLRDYWGWSVADFKRSLKQQILSEKVAAALDTGAEQKAAAALAQLKAGADFGTLAKQVSEDPSAASNGGDYGAAITKDNPNVPPQVVEALFALKESQISGVIDAGPTLEIVKVTQISGNGVTAQHISFKLADISAFIDPLKAKSPPKIYVHF